MAEVPEIDGYSDLVQIAKGGFGVVYRARQDRFGRTVALKVLNVADLDDRGQQRFERECVAMGSLGWHPNVVAVFDSGITADGRPWLSMEFLEGGSLGDRLKHGPLPWQEVVIAGVQVAGALDAAHAAGVLHRDLKPENLLVGPYGEVKLGDFGIAAVEGSTRTTTGHASFTASHVAPEILRRQRPDERSDLYSLASTLHTLIAGSPPFGGQPDEPIEAIITSVLHDAPPRLHAVPDDLADLLARTLAKEPSDRPTSAEEFGRVLQRVQADQDQPVADLRLAPTTRGSAPVAESPANINPVPPPEPVTGDPLPTIDHQAPTPPQGDPLATIDHTQLGSPEPPEQTPSDGEGKTDDPSPIRSPEPRPAPTVADPAPRPHRRLAVTLVGVAGVLFLGAASLIATRHDTATDTGSTPTQVPTAATVATPPEVVATIPVGTLPEGVAATDTAVWVTNANDTVTRIDPATNEVAATIEVGDRPIGVAATATAVWVTNFGDHTVTRIDPATNEVTATIPSGNFPYGVAATATAVWVANNFDATVTRIDPATNEIAATIPVNDGPKAIAATAAAVWVTEPFDGTVTRIDPATNEVAATIPIGDLEGVAAADTAVWVTSPADDTVTRINPATNETTDTIEVGSAPSGVAATATAVWVTNFDDNSVTRISTATNRTTATITIIGGNPIGVAVTATAVWVSNYLEDGTVTRIDSEPR